MKRKFEEVDEEKIEGDIQDDFKVELFNEDETELITKSGENFCETQVKIEINDHDEIRENEIMKIEIFEDDVKHEKNDYEGVAEDENQVVKIEINDQEIDETENSRWDTPPSNDALRKVFATGLKYTCK